MYRELSKAEPRSLCCPADGQAIEKANILHLFVTSQTRRSFRGRVAGFTLVELMITVAIVAILASVALPGYTSYVQRSNRGDAQGFLSEVAARQQQFLLDRRSFAVSVTGTTAANGMSMTVPANVAARYTVSLIADNAARPPVFTVTATPTGSQVADACGTLRIDQAGTKSATGTGSCW